MDVALGDEQHPFTRRVGPRFGSLDRDEQTRRAIGEIRRLKRQLGDTAAPSPSDCKQAAGRAVSGAASPLDGDYRSTVTRAQLLDHAAFEQGEDNPGARGHFELTIGSGRFELTGADDDVPLGGTLATDGDRVTFRPTHPGEVAGETFVYRWSRYRGALTFTKVSTGPTVMVVQPWQPRP